MGIFTREATILFLPPFSVSSTLKGKNLLKGGLVKALRAVNQPLQKITLINSEKGDGYTFRRSRHTLLVSHLIRVIS